MWVGESGSSGWDGARWDNRVCMYSEEKANQMYWLTVRTMEEIVRGGTWALVLNRRVERHDCSGEGEAMV